jgi:hypothetical protein
MGHVRYLGEIKNIKSGTPEGKRQLGRRRSRCDDNINVKNKRK